MRNIRFKTFGTLLVAVIGICLLVAGQVSAAQQKSKGGNRSARGNQAAQSRQSRPPSHAQRGKTPEKRSVERRQSAPARQKPSARSKSNHQRSQAQRQSAPARQKPSARSQNNRQRSHAQSKSPAKRSTAGKHHNARQSVRNRPATPRAGTKSGGNIRRQSPKASRSAGRNRADVARDRAKHKSIDRQHQPKASSKHHQPKAGSKHLKPKSNHSFKAPKSNHNATKRGNIKRRGHSDFGKRPVPKARGGHSRQHPKALNRNHIKDARKRLDSHGYAKQHKPPKHGRGKPNFKLPHRMHKADLHRMTGGKSARSIKLAEQYRMTRHGDVARRMGLYNHHGPRPDFHRGRVSPHYNKHCFKHRYWGPSWFIGVHWYPRYDSWVRWSWGYNCNPYWDPRPIYCRPIVYAPAPAWVYWETPVWTPLPVVSSGTWVDLPPAAVSDPRHDLQLVAVRFVDPGHPDEKLGPRYRVWFRNNGGRPIVAPFDVMLFAGDDRKIAAGLPQVGVRVKSIEPGAVQSVDIRLPFNVYEIERDAKGDAAPFSVLHVLVDAGDEIAETAEANNGASLAPADILPIDPAAFELDPASAKSGGEVVLAGEGFGPQPGQVILVIGGKEIDAEIVGWYDMGVRFILPRIVATGPVEAEVIVVRGDRAAANPLKFTIRP